MALSLPPGGIPGVVFLDRQQLPWISALMLYLNGRFSNPSTSAIPKRCLHFKTTHDDYEENSNLYKFVAFNITLLLFHQISFHS